ncbi:SH3 domain-containing protein [Salinimicrobium catena]|uniref:SH3 domain-containing protein n=1 Tax=Salinimicrobium catena TaxID=390640 RepID=A0A1H5J209_9FLAO|nr:tetratricopeptide repeat protein [Salinimicrobium catena]SDK83221.1 SH3 domain-containing protein [Salinimicrobium catena]SEE46512.1 SH3 domain-containing protein [Salinimicrobium catena]
MKKLIYLLLMLFGLSGMAQNEEAFEKANSAYADGDYEEAVELYNQILENGEASVAVHYNLGNSYYKLNRIGPSIYHYEKALKMKPGDQDVVNNLQFARNMAIDVIEEPREGGFSQFLDSTTQLFSPSGWGWVAIFCMLLFVAFFLAYYFSRKTLFKRMFFITGMIFLLLGITSAVIGNLKQNLLENRSFAIVFSEEADVRSEPNVRSDEVFLLHEGAKVKVTEDFQGWYEIELPNGSQGWIEKSALRLL